MTYSWQFKLLVFNIHNVSLPQSEPQYVPAKFDDKASGTESDDCESNFKQIMVYHRRTNVAELKFKAAWAVNFVFFSSSQNLIYTKNKQFEWF